ncbi:hypothetical protein [Actinomycetospora cinnamomea]|uniref:Uncharacterized protein n=1 Tax=Actinomycetospora cinnamomea TaxID=663609 RepID=A0A2U1FFV0_9PSEU|nr:hypothetical protein [Actinomycetospora cinnamomea]PVZ11006.1 hypothetical protein C8D89_104220 [Actinomycetospora cinnamomea]
MVADERLKADLLGEAEEEPLDLFHAIAVVKIVEGGEGRLPLLRRTGPMMVELVRDGRFVCGDWASGGIGFEVWDMTADEAADRVQDYVQRVLDGEQQFIPEEPCLFALPEYVRT